MDRWDEVSRMICRDRRVGKRRKAAVRERENGRVSLETRYSPIES